MRALLSFNLTWRSSSFFIIRWVHSILCSRDASDDAFARSTHIFEAALSCHVDVPPSTNPSQNFPRSRWSRISTWFPRRAQDLRTPSNGPPSAASSLRRIRSAQSRKRANRRGCFQELHSLERERDEGRAEPREGTKCVAVRGWRTTASNARSGFHLLRNTCPPLLFRVLD